MFQRLIRKLLNRSPSRRGLSTAHDVRFRPALETLEEQLDD